MTPPTDFFNIPIEVGDRIVYVTSYGWVQFHEAVVEKVWEAARPEWLAAESPAPVRINVRKLGKTEYETSDVVTLKQEKTILVLEKGYEKE